MQFIKTGEFFSVVWKWVNAIEAVESAKSDFIEEVVGEPSPSIVSKLVIAAGNAFHVTCHTVYP